MSSLLTLRYFNFEFIFYSIHKTDSNELNFLKTNNLLFSIRFLIFALDFNWST
jgi:hypothetical protein